MKTPIQLRPGDVLLYSKSDFFGMITSFRTFSPAVHVELFEGDGVSLASRNGIGVNRYPLRMAQLAAVLRPVDAIDMEAIRKWFEVSFDQQTKKGVRGRKYGWLDLLRFYGIKFPTEGWICSQFVAYALQAGGLKVFAGHYYKGTIDPGDYFLPAALTWEWVRPDVYKELTT